MFSFMADMPVR